MKTLNLTLVFPVRDGKVLLGKKRDEYEKPRGQLNVGKGKWNGFGGALNPHESFNRAWKRELKEECGLTGLNASRRTTIECALLHKNLKVRIRCFLCEDFTGKPRLTKEIGQLRWWKIGHLPFRRMWASDAHWLNGFLIGEGLARKYRFVFADEDTLIDAKVL